MCLIVQLLFVEFDLSEAMETNSMITEKFAEEEVAINTNYISDTGAIESIINNDKRQLVPDAKKDLNCKYL